MWQKQLHIYACMHLGTYYICMHVHTCMHTLQVTVPHGVMLTYNSSSSANGSHVIEYEVLHNSEIH